VKPCHPLVPWACYAAIATLSVLLASGAAGLLVYERAAASAAVCSHRDPAFLIFTE